jgi:hypothetical protein
VNARQASEVRFREVEFRHFVEEMLPLSWFQFVALDEPLGNVAVVRVVYSGDEKQDIPHVNLLG